VRQPFELVGQEPEPFGIEVPAGDRQLDRPGVRLGQPIQVTAQGRHQRVAVAVVDKFGPQSVLLC